jgi:hypothetical protein
LRTEIIHFLFQTQNPDGGWGYFPGKSSTIEATALALLGLRQQPASIPCNQKAISFLKIRQTGTGGWPVNTFESEAASWVSALAAQALLEADGSGEPVERAVRYLQSTFGKVPLTWGLRLAIALGNNQGFPFDIRYGGWSWNPATAPWVEPTSYALLFLKRLGASRLPAESQGIIQEAEKMMYDRICPSGGWNYGNARVLGEDLKPYPLTTALALMALQNHPDREENRRSLAYLKNALAEEKSALSLAYATLCLDLYLIREPSTTETLQRNWKENHFFKNTKTAALALMALDLGESENPFRIAGPPRRV